MFLLLMLIFCSYFFGLGRGCYVHAHEFAQHMHMKIETYAHARTQVEETPEARL